MFNHEDYVPQAKQNKYDDYVIAVKPKEEEIVEYDEEEEVKEN